MRFRFLQSSVPLAREALIVWPLAGAINFIGVKVCEPFVPSLGDIPAARLVGPFLIWTALAPLIAIMAAAWRPRVTPLWRIVAGHALLFLIGAEIQSRVSTAMPLFSRIPASAAQSLLLGFIIYASIVCTTWTALLMRDIAATAEYEALAARSEAAAGVQRLALPRRYLTMLLRRIGSVLTEPARAEVSALAVAGLLRSQLDAMRDGLWSLGRELELLDGFLDFERSHGVDWRVVANAGPGVDRKSLWPGSLAVETAAFLAADGGGGTVDLDIDADGETLSVVVSVSGRRVTFAIAPPPVGGAGKPAGQLSRFAAAMAAKGKVAAGAVIAASWLLGVALHLTFVSTISAVGIVWSMIQVALRLGFVLPLVSAMPVERAARPLRFFGLVFAAAMAGEWYYQIVVGRFFGNPWPAVAMMSALAPVSSIAVVFVSVAAAAAVVRMLKVGRTAFAHDQRALSSELRLRESQERFLRWQMSPHFLFNALNSLAALIRRDPAMAARFFGMLDHFFEQVASLEGRTHTLDEEIRLLSSYFAIERVRFGEAISFIVDADPALRQAPVPALILQPLAENATKHGVLREGTMAIGLAVRNTGSGLRISMSNPSEEPQTARRDGAGLRITRERLAAAYGDRANLETTFAGGWFTATMLLSSRP